MKQYFVYIVTNKKDGVLYTGVTNDLLRRIYEHRNSMIEGFTKKYSLKFLVYYEMFQNIDKAIEREKIIKKWNRDWKVKLIETKNPQWRDLYTEIASF